MKTIIPAFLVAVFFICCSSSVKVSTSSNKKHSLVNYKTYSWQDFKKIKGAETHPIYYNELNDFRIRKAVDSQMQLMHFQLIDSGGALQISYRFIIRSKIKVDDKYQDPQYYNNAIVPYYNNYSTGSRYDFQFPESPLIIEMTDSKTHALIWEEQAPNAINSTMNKRPETVIQDAVKEIFKRFPAGKE